MVVLAWGLPKLVERIDSTPACHRSSIKADLAWIYNVAFPVFVISVICWLADNYGCVALQNMPFGLPYLHLHAWWHILISPVLYTVVLVFQADDKRASNSMQMVFRCGLPIILSKTLD